MADVKFACPGCQLHIKVGVEYVGMTSTCPECQQQFKIPAPPGEVKFACGGCQLRLALHESYIGTQITCPSCNANVIVPNPAAPAAVKPAPAPAPAPARPAAAAPAKPKAVPVKPKAVSAADRVGSPPAAARPAAPAAPAGTGPTTRPPNVGAPPSSGPPPSLPASAAPAAANGACPKCGVAMEADAIICTSCGYNAETGEEMESAVVKVKPPPPPAGGLPPGGRRAAVKPKVAAVRAASGEGPGTAAKIIFWFSVGVSLTLAVASFLAPVAFSFLPLVAIGIWFIAGIWALVDAYKTDLTQFLLCLLVPVYQIYFVYFISGNRSLRTVYTGSLISLGLMLLGLGIVIAKTAAAGPPPSGL